MPLQPPTRTSMVLEAKAAVVTLLTNGLKAKYGEERDGLVAPVVSYGMPDDVDQTNEIVIVGGAESQDDWSEIGRGARDEYFTLTLVVSVWRDGQTQQEVTERALTLLRDCDQILTAAQVLPPPAWALVLFGRLLEGAHTTKNGRIAEVIGGVKFYARL